MEYFIISLLITQILGFTTTAIILSFREKSRYRIKKNTIKEIRIPISVERKDAFKIIFILFTISFFESLLVMEIFKSN